MPAFASRFAALAAVLSIAVAAGASAGEIYKWTDASGNVHYGDKPAPDGSSERLDIDSQATDRQRVASLVSARQEDRAAAREEQAAQANAEPTPEEQRQAEAERQKQCATYRERLQTFVQSRRLYREDDNGERVYLDEEETLAARNRVQQKVQEYCSD
jgi:hypothetical protein